MSVVWNYDWTFNYDENDPAQSDKRRIKIIHTNNQRRSAEVGKQIKQFKAQHSTIAEQQILKLIR